MKRAAELLMHPFWALALIVSALALWARFAGADPGPEPRHRPDHPAECHGCLLALEEASP